MAAVEAKKKAATQRVSGRWAEATRAVVTRVGGTKLGHAPRGCQASCSAPAGSGSGSGGTDKLISTVIN